MTREEFISWFQDFTLLTPNDIYDLGQLYDEVTKPHWISVDEELPPTSDKDDESDDYLTVDSDGDKNVGYYNKMDELWFSCDGHILDVTHWMPMPEAPSSSEIPNNSKKGGKE